MAAAIGDLRLGWFGGEEARAEPEVAGLVRSFNGLLYRVAYSVVRNEAEAEDVVQETFLRVVEQRGKLAGVREMRAWLVRICWNLALDRRRRIRPAQMEEGFADAIVAREPGVEQRMGEAREVELVFAAIDRLPAAERDCLLLCAVEGLTTAEVAVVLKRSESSVRSLVFRARVHLKERLGAEFERGAVR